MVQELFLAECVGLSQEEVVKFVAVKFAVGEETLSQFEFLIAHLDEDGYDGSAHFLVRHRETGELFEVNALHCSCYDFQGQWEPKVTTVAYLTSEHYAFGRGQETVQTFIKSMFNN
jgi:hypothetical protein